jgi:hypothetical protein
MSDRIMCAEDFYIASGAAPAEACVVQHWHRRDVAREPIVPKQVAPGQAIQVYVNHGRWIAECPDCRGAQVAARSDPRFFCVDCLNAWCGGRWVRLVWPPDASDIEALLLKRETHHRNWSPGESVNDLLAENVAHATILSSPPPGLVIADDERRIHDLRKS